MSRHGRTRADTQRRLSFKAPWSHHDERATTTCSLTHGVLCWYAVLQHTTNSRCLCIKRDSAAIHSWYTLVVRGFLCCQTLLVHIACDSRTDIPCAILLGDNVPQETQEHYEFFFKLSEGRREVAGDRRQAAWGTAAGAGSTGHTAGQGAGSRRQAVGGRRQTARTSRHAAGCSWRTAGGLRHAGRGRWLAAGTRLAPHVGCPDAFLPRNRPCTCGRMRGNMRTRKVWAMYKRTRKLWTMCMWTRKVWAIHGLNGSSRREATYCCCVVFAAARQKWNRVHVEKWNPRADTW